jgi:hypothetical protein
MYAPRIDTQHVDHLGFLRAARITAPSGALDPPEHRQGKGEADADDGEAIGGIAESGSDRHREIEQRGHGHRIEIVADEKERASSNSKMRRRSAALVEVSRA